uniref:Tetratricopeptide repeat-containing protein n=1 Tax=Toxoplasma gondii COUG TaxID=1074873 RepID=A0A2G8YBR5_TOXGO|nr:tetratricopeptide repeat-containing protein [Toxoplasma gondii COUG]
MVFLIIVFSLTLAVLVGWVLQRQLHTIFTSSISTFFLPLYGGPKTTSSTEKAEGGSCAASAETTLKTGSEPQVAVKGSEKGANGRGRTLLETVVGDEEELEAAVAGGVRMATLVATGEEKEPEDAEEEEERPQSKKASYAEREERNAVIFSDCADTPGTSVLSFSSLQKASLTDKQRGEGQCAQDAGKKHGDSERNRRHQSDVFPSPPSSGPASPREAPDAPLLADEDIACLTPAEESFLLEQDRRIRGCFKYDHAESRPSSSSTSSSFRVSSPLQSRSDPSSLLPSGSAHVTKSECPRAPPVLAAPTSSLNEEPQEGAPESQGRGEKEAEKHFSNLRDTVEARSPSQRSTSAAPSPSNAGASTEIGELNSTATASGTREVGEAKPKAAVSEENLESSLCQESQDESEPKVAADPVASHEGEEDGVAEAECEDTPQGEARNARGAAENEPATAPLLGEENEKAATEESVHAVGSVVEVEDDQVKQERGGFPRECVGGEEGDDEREDEEENNPKVEDLGEVFPEERQDPPRFEEVEDEKKDEEDLEDKTAAELKELGNQKFREGKYEAALDIYTQALDRLDEEEDDWLDEFDAAMQDKEDELEAAENIRYERSLRGEAPNGEHGAEDQKLFKDAREEEEARETKETNDDAKGTEEDAPEQRGAREDSVAQAAVQKGHDSADEKETCEKGGSPEKEDISEKEETREKEEKSGDEEHLLTEAEFLAFKEKKEKEREAMALEFNQLRAVLLSNRGACHLHGKCWEAVVADCTEAIQCDPSYAKAYLRRFTANEALTKWHDAAADINKAIELDPSLEARYRSDQQRVKKKSEAQFEKEKEEMIGKLKDFGNFVLGKVGLSLDNFKVEQNPDTGAYNISFQQNAQPPAGAAASQ